MLMNKILNKLLITCLVIIPIKCEKKCIPFKKSNTCAEYIVDKKHPTYLSPYLSDDFNLKATDVTEFENAFGKITFNPIYPADSSTLQKEFGCRYDPTSFHMRYAESFFCNFIFHTIDRGCNKKSKEAFPVFCNTSCLTYYEQIQLIFNDTLICPQGTEKVMQNRQKRLQIIKDHCDTDTSKTDECLIGSGVEKKYCGFRDEKEKEDYCNKYQKIDPCCSYDENNNNKSINLLTIIMYAAIFLVILLIVVLIVLKVYSKGKNKRDEEKKLETEALERKREEERERYREQLTKELSSDSLSNVNAPLLQKSESFNSPYQSPVGPSPIGPSPIITPRSAHPPQSTRPPLQHTDSRGTNLPYTQPPNRNGSSASNSHPPPHRMGSGDSSVISSRPPARDSPRVGPHPPQHQGSRDSPRVGPHPPQHQGSRDSPRVRPPQHQGSRDSPRVGPRPPQHQGSRDSPRVGPRPAHHQGSKDSPRVGPHPPHHQGPRDSPRNSPAHGPRDSPRNSPAHGPRNSPRNSPQIHPPTRSSPNSAPSRPPQNSRPHLPDNSNRY